MYTLSLLSVVTTCNCQGLPKQPPIWFSHVVSVLAIDPLICGGDGKMEMGSGKMSLPVDLKCLQGPLKYKSHHIISLANSSKVIHFFSNKEKTPWICSRKFWNDLSPDHLSSSLLNCYFLPHSPHSNLWLLSDSNMTACADKV